MAETAPELLTGIDAIVRIGREQRLRDRAAGLRTATFASGYPGSPLGGLDVALEAAHDDDLVHVPALNEELAAAAVWGTQQPPALEGGYDGIVGLWYGKSPGADRCGDVFKHANFVGPSRHGGVLAIVGDDPTAKSSTLPNDSVGAFVDAAMPVLAPARVEEIVQLGLHGIALSRFSGLWVGLRVVTRLADGFASVSAAELAPELVAPPGELDGEPWSHVQRPALSNAVSPLQESEIFNRRLRAAELYCERNRLNRVVRDDAGARIGIVAVGPALSQVEEALALLDGHEPVRVLKVAMPFPLEPSAVRRFADGLDRVIVVEDKRRFVESLVRDALYDEPRRPTVAGKRDELGRALIASDGELTAERLAAPLARELGTRAPELPVVAPSAPARMPAFCSGCPHNRSTVAAEGTLVGGGVGCHAIVYLESRHERDPMLGLTPMGSEGVPWIGAAPFAARRHMVQNLGDGTFAHSGSLAIRATAAAGVDITFKLLLNGAVAMTGGQDVVGVRGVPAVTRELEALGVARTIVCTDDTRRYGRRARWAAGVEVWPRDRLAEAETALAATPGVTVIVFDQACAANRRRDWRRGRAERTRKRIVINEAVCEGCGDCQVKSNCLSVRPVETSLGRKTQIHQPSCNSDFTCIEGDCPSFLEIELTGEERLPAPAPAPAVPPPPRAPERDEHAIYMVGIGGSGVVTANRLLARAGLDAGWHVLGMDQTGLSQKGGTVTSHLRLTRSRSPAANTVGPRQADVYLAFDQLAGAEPRHLATVERGRTVAIVSSTAVPTPTDIVDPGLPVPRTGDRVEEIARATGADALVQCDAGALSELLFGDDLPANVILLGAALQAGALPFGAELLERAIGTGPAAERNLQALRWGRAAVAHPEAVAAIVAGRAVVRPPEREPSAGAWRLARQALDRSSIAAPVRDAVEWRYADLVDYQDRRLAQAYLDAVEACWAAERAAAPERTELSDAVARNLYKLTAYKDEYEVARLHLDAAMREHVHARFPGARTSVLLHPPFLRALGMKRKLRAGAWSVATFRALRAMRRLRGGPLDLFGRSRVRRIERRLVAQYAETIAALAQRLTAERYDHAVEIARLPESVRGYEDVKLRSVEAYDERLKALTTTGLTW
jgi:indolepyruvate ferredoxin oxidoreductase